MSDQVKTVGQPRRSWSTADPDSTMTSYMGIEGRISVADLLKYFADHHPHVDPMGVMLNFATAKWEDAPTREEQDARTAWKLDQERRTLEWETATYHRLKAKFESGADER